MEITTIIALVIALAAVVVGPVIQLQIAKQQIRAQLVSANRLKWIEGVRSHIADFVAASSRAQVAFCFARDDTTELLSMNGALENVTLLLNPGKELHAKLLQELKHVGNSVASASFDIDKTRQKGEVDVERVLEAYAIDENLCAKVYDAARSVLKTEWERVKRGE